MRESEVRITGEYTGGRVGDLHRLPKNNKKEGAEQSKRIKQEQ
jgi:hypothetical protein